MQTDLSTCPWDVPPWRCKSRPQCEGCGAVFAEKQFDLLPFLFVNIIWNIEARQCPRCDRAVLGWLAQRPTPRKGEKEEER
jgi:hypothetical protein